MRRLAIVLVVGASLGLVACAEESTPINATQVYITDPSGSYDYRQAYEACHHRGMVIADVRPLDSDHEDALVTCRH